MKSRMRGVSLVSSARNAAGAVIRVVTQPPRNTSKRVAANRGASRSIRMNCRAPDWSDGTRVAPWTSQPELSRTTIAPGPARSLARVSTDRPSLTVTSATFQPAGRNRTKGTSDADGTDCASNHSASRRVQPRSERMSGVLPTQLVRFLGMVIHSYASSTATSAHGPKRRAVHRWIRTGRERLRDLLDGELAKSPLVDPGRVAEQRQDQHHVGQIDRLTPRA